MKYLLFFLFLISCEPSHLVLKGDCQLGETKNFEASNGGYITASVDTIGKLQLIGNLNLVAGPIKVVTELQDSIFEEWEAKPMKLGKSFEYQIRLNLEGAKSFEFELIYIKE